MHSKRLINSTSLEVYAAQPYGDASLVCTKL